MILKKINVSLSMLCPIVVCRTPIPKYHVLTLLFALSHTENVVYYLQSATTFKMFYKPATRGNVFFDFFKVKNEEEL